jgi:mRNA-degrading endonuclease YafQ of YafQ-DinJ toxin-antitoxin module
MEVLYTARFLRSYSKLSASVKSDIDSAVQVFKKNPKHPSSIRFHKLQGRMKEYHAFSANYSYRVVVKLDKRIAYCMDVGNHSVYE